jgi:hypothetical protein
MLEIRACPRPVAEEVRRPAAVAVGYLDDSHVPSALGDLDRPQRIAQRFVIVATRRASGAELIQRRAEDVQVVSPSMHTSEKALQVVFRLLQTAEHRERMTTPYLGGIEQGGGM